ncbi:MAG TPA: glycosyltransferase family 1 protein [Kiritimatiellia bacterium]|nr:glycosyltransferase family 1 protein [Kiritimatiellia bacterium]HRU70154.1 glycosyltransferase family 1 protein [Kiritimatiellia bacterium]
MANDHTLLFDARAATPDYPGIDRYIRALLAALLPDLRPDERLHVILPQETEIPCLDHPGVTIHRVDANLTTFRSHWQTLRLVRAIRPQVIHAPYILTPLRVPGKLVLTVHDVIPLSHPQYSSLVTRLFWHVVGRRALRHCRKLIGVSEDALKNCARFFGARAVRRSVVIHHGIDPAFHPQNEAAIEAVRRTYGLPDRFLLYVGSDRPHKNVTTLLHALALMDPTASMPLALAGFDGDSTPLRREAEELKLTQRVLWLGRIPEADLPALYSAAHAFLFPSLVEGFGFPVLEAMACGTPVICSALGVHKEISGGAAKLVHPTDRQEWRRAIHAAIISLDWHDVYREKGLARAARFSWAETARATLDIYRQLYPRH